MRIEREIYEEWVKGASEAQLAMRFHYERETIRRILKFQKKLAGYPIEQLNLPDTAQED